MKYLDGNYYVEVKETVDDHYENDINSLNGVVIPNHYVGIKN